MMSPSTGSAANRDDIIVRLLAFMVNHGLAVEARMQISLLPVDVAADNMAAIFRDPRSAGGSFHVTVDDYCNMMDITRIITRDFGYPFTYYDIPGFVAEIRRRCTKDDPLYPLLDFIDRVRPKLGAMQNKRYNNDAYREARTRCGNGRPEPRLAETVSYAMRYLLREGLVR
jgi:hypothetical protein